MTRLDNIFSAIDKANTEDPRASTDENGKKHPQELLYGLRMSTRLNLDRPDASEELQIAVRAQHICRWKIPRTDYPEGRTGYKNWRRDLSQYHAKTVGELMTDCGYTQIQQDRVADLIQKRELKSDPEAQALEDTACLVFLEYYFADFAEKHDDAKIVSILQKTWAKMSGQAHHTALTLSYPDSVAPLLKRALGE